MSTQQLIYYYLDTQFEAIGNCKPWRAIHYYTWACVTIAPRTAYSHFNTWRRRKQAMAPWYQKVKKNTENERNTSQIEEKKKKKRKVKDQTFGLMVSTVTEGAMLVGEGGEEE